ncbi:hypothetical protein JXL19_11785 [bacterium]|nr:hypothetical protein [bacterium]
MLKKIHQNRAFLLIMFFLVLVALFYSIYLIQITIDNNYRINKEERLLYLPSGRFLKPICLGYEAVVSDFLWLKAISYFGGHYFTDQSYKWLYHILDLVTTLDPMFRYPYEFGGVVLALEEGNTRQSTALMEKGIKYHPDYWRLHFYLGFNYFYYHKDSKMAAFYINRAVELPGHPEYLPKLAASLLTQAGKKDTALSFLRQIYKNTNDEWLREKIQKKMDDLLAGNLPETLKGLFQE